MEREADEKGEAGGGEADGGPGCRALPVVRFPDKNKDMFRERLDLIPDPVSAGQVQGADGPVGQGVIRDARIEDEAEEGRSPTTRKLVATDQFTLCNYS
jgi:hypothetical protein